MGVSVGFGVGPVRFSTRLSGGGRGGDQSEDSFIFVAVIGVIALFCVGPWAAIHSLDGHWGVTAMVAGIAYLVASPVLMFFRLPAAFIGTSWGLYASWLLGYWHVAGGLFGWFGGLLPTDPSASLDAFVLSGLLLLLGLLLGLVVVAPPVGVSLFTAMKINDLLLVAMTPTTADAEPVASVLP